jgi:hypothetical protein
MGPHQSAHFPAVAKKISLYDIRASSNRFDGGSILFSLTSRQRQALGQSDPRQRLSNRTIGIEHLTQTEVEKFSGEDARNGRPPRQREIRRSFARTKRPKSRK